MEWAKLKVGERVNRVKYERIKNLELGDAILPISLAITTNTLKFSEIPLPHPLHEMIILCSHQGAQGE